MIAIVAAGAGISNAADRFIEAAANDLDRYESEAKTLTPARKANIKRLQRLLTLTEQRLKQSDKQDDPAWTAVETRLKTLQSRLEDMLGGRTNMPNARPAATTQQVRPVAPATADTDLPLIRVESGNRIPLGRAAQLSGLVGDAGSPPRLKVNGNPVTLFRPEAEQKPIANHTLAFRVQIPTDKAATKRYVLEACDAAGNCVGEEVVLTIGGQDQPAITGRNFALVIGNNAYRNLTPLKTAVNDATALASLLSDRYEFAPENVRLLLNADRNAILGAIEGLREVLEPDDRLVIYYAGHGEIDQATGEGFWLPVDAAADKTYTWIANDDIRRQLKGLLARHVLVIADSCFSGSLTRSASQSGGAGDRYFAEIDSHISRKVISSGGTEPVADAGAGGHSVFAYHLLRTLSGNDQPYITSSELFSKFVRAVTNNSDQKPEFGTIAKAGDEGGGDFTFIKRSVAE
jgi:uncharacterized caspase-like protein